MFCLSLIVSGAIAQANTDTTTTNRPPRVSRESQLNVVTNAVSNAVSRVRPPPPQIVITNGVAVADYTPNRIVFEANLNSSSTNGVVHLTTAEGKELNSRVIGLSYFSSATG